MHDDELRQELDSLLRPVREAAPPELPVIRRRLTRLRRRRVSAAGMSAVATAAAIAIGVVAVHAAGGPASDASGTRPTAVSAASTRPTPVGNGYQSTASYTVTSTVTSLVVTGDLGGIRVTGGDGTATSVNAVLYYTTTPPTLTRTLTGSTLTLGYSCPRNDSCGVGFDVQVPRTTVVRANESTGGISLTGLAGDVTATNQIGAITAVNLTSRMVSLHTSTGGISASLLAPPTSLTATSNVGAIAIGLPGNVSYRVNASTDVGSTSVTVPVDQGSRYSITASTDTGRVSVTTGTANLARG